MIDGHAHACGDLLTRDGIMSALHRDGVDKVVLVPGQHGSGRTYPLPDLARRFPTREVADLTNAMTTLVVWATGSASRVEEDNAAVFRLAKACAGRVLQFYWVMLGHGFDEATVEIRRSAWQFKGLKVHQCWDAFDVRGPAFGELTRYAAAHDLPVFVHLKGAAQAEALAGVAAADPGTTFIVGHLYGVERFMRFPRPLANLYFDLSCPDLVSDARLEAALRCFGPDRLLLGSDTPYGRDNLARGVDRIRSLAISDSDKDLILGGNMARLLGLPTG